MVFLCNPNNPTGSLAEPRTVAATLEACSRVGAVLVVDECFLPFTDGPSCKGLLQEYPNLIVLGPLPSCMPWRDCGWVFALLRRGPGRADCRLGPVLERLHPRPRWRGWRP